MITVANKIINQQHIDTLNQESWAIRSLNTERAQELAGEAYEHSYKLNYTTGIAHSLRNMAIVISYFQITMPP